MIHKINTFYSLLKSDHGSLKFAMIKKIGFLFSDKKYLKLLFKCRMGYSLDLNNPKTYNEKLQWLKLYDHRPEYKKMVDKYEVKKYVAGIIGEKYVIPTFKVWNSLKEIDWKCLPDQFVIKTTHGGGGGGVYICKKRNDLNISEAKRVLELSLKQDIFKNLREWPYKGMKKRIIAEQLLVEKGQDSLHDYKVMCFDGKPKLIEFHEGRFTSKHTQGFYDCEWNKLPINQKSYGEITDYVSARPELLEEMIRLSEVLAKDVPHVRIDWYIVQHRLYFGEITFFDASGFDAFIPDEYNYILGDWISLPSKQK